MKALGAEMKNDLLMYCACLVFRAFQKLRKTNSNFVVLSVSVRPSAWNNSVPTGLIFIKFDIHVLFETQTSKFEFN